MNIFFKSEEEDEDYCEHCNNTGYVTNSWGGYETPCPYCNNNSDPSLFGSGD